MRNKSTRASENERDKPVVCIAINVDLFSSGILISVFVSDSYSTLVDNLTWESESEAHAIRGSVGELP